MKVRLTLAVVWAAAQLAAQGVVIVNGASFRPEVSAGSWATAGGSFGTVANTTATAFPIPTTLNGVSVTVDGVAAPVYFVSSTQINFLVPYGVSAGVRPVVVRTAASAFNGTARVLSAAPGVFVQDAAVPPKGAILNQNSSLNTQSAPARRGEVIQIFGTGPGGLSANPADGAAVTGAIVSTRSTPQVFIGGVPAQVEFSGLTPGQTSLWQVNAVVPNQSFLNGRVPVSVFIDGVDANEVAVFVQ
jgi:uncharacterized protein (TIGR03437 family)